VNGLRYVSRRGGGCLSFGVAEGLWAPARDSESGARRAAQRYYNARHRIARSCNPANPVLLKVVDQAAMLSETFLRQTGPVVTVTEPVSRLGIESTEHVIRWLALSIGSLMYEIRRRPVSNFVLLNPWR
jgi:hypothetical protein